MPNDWAQYGAWQKAHQSGALGKDANGAPQLDPQMFATPPIPGGWANAARSTKADAFSEQFGGILTAGTNYANYLTSEETRRYNQSNATLADAATRFDKPSMNDQDIARMFSGYADKSAMDYSKSLGQLRTTMGGSGVTGGGWAGGQQGRFAAARMASMTDATRTLYEKRIDADMHDRMDRWLAQQAVAAGQARDPSIVGLDWLGKALGSVTDKYAMDTQASAARHAADDAKTAGYFDLAKGAIGAVGAFA